VIPNFAGKTITAAESVLKNSEEKIALMITKRVEKKINRITIPPVF